MNHVSSYEVIDTSDGLSTAVIRFDVPMECLSSAMLNGGQSVTRTIMIMQVPHEFDHRDPYERIHSRRKELGLPEDTVGLMTAAEVKYVFSTKHAEYDDVGVFVAATAGLSNHVRAGEVMTDWETRHRISMERFHKLMAGTINIVVVSPFALTTEAKVNLFIPLVEAKALALREMGYEETGTTSDSMVVVSPISDDREMYSGTGMPLGIATARAVKSAVKDSLCKRGDYPVASDYRKILAQAGIDDDALWDRVRGTFPDIERKAFFSVAYELCSDPDVSAYVNMAAFMDDMGPKGCIYNIPKDDYHLAGLVSDIALGEMLAQHISDDSVNGYRSVIDGVPSANRFISCVVWGLIAGIVGRLRNDRR